MLHIEIKLGLNQPTHKTNNYCVQIKSCQTAVTLLKETHRVQYALVFLMLMLDSSSSQMPRL